MSESNVITLPSTVKPKPCPFCGCDHVDFLESGDNGDGAMQCEECLAQGPHATIGCRDPEEDEIDIEAEALDLWNDRK